MSNVRFGLRPEVMAGIGHVRSGQKAGVRRASPLVRPGVDSGHHAPFWVRRKLL